MGCQNIKRWKFYKLLAKTLDIESKKDYNSDSISMPT